MKIYQTNERAIQSLPSDLQKVLEQDINDAIKERVKVLRKAVGNNGRMYEAPIPSA